MGCGHHREHRSQAGQRGGGWEPTALLTLGGLPIRTRPGPVNIRAAWGPSRRAPQDSQDVADDPDTPHVCGVADGLVVDHFRCDELWGAKEDLQRARVLCNQDGEGSIARTSLSQPEVSRCLGGTQARPAFSGSPPAGRHRDNSLLVEQGHRHTSGTALPRMEWLSMCLSLP